MLADFAAKRLTMDGVNVYMVPGEGIMYEGQAVYSIHKTEAIDLINEYFRPYQNDTYSDTEENLGDIHNGDTEDGKQNIYSNGN